MAVADWRKPHIRMKNKLTHFVRKGCEVAGRYQGYSLAELETAQSDRVDFIGDIPSVAGLNPYQHREYYVLDRPSVETIQNVVYTPAGHAWVNGKLIERLSVREPSVREMLAGEPKKTGTSLKEAWLIEGKTPFTYGDWVGDHVRALVEADQDIDLVVLPLFLAEKTYVQRDLANLGIELRAADEPINIEPAHVLRKTVPSYYWGPQQVDAYRHRFNTKLHTPQKGSLIYLSRANFISEVVDRTYPSAAIADYLQKLGGKVFDTRQASPEAFEKIADSVETVIADQGSAIFGVLQ